MFDYLIKPATRQDRFDPTRIKQLSQTYGGVVISPEHISSEDIEIITKFAQTPLPYTGKRFYAFSDFMNGHNTSEFIKNLPSSLKKLILADGRDLERLTGISSSKLSVHFNTLATLNLPWHIDDILEYWLFRQLPGERRLEVFNPKKTTAVRDRGIDNIHISNNDLKNLVNQHPGRIAQMSPFERLFFTSHLAHKSGEGMTGMGYTIKPN